MPHLLRGLQVTKVDFVDRMADPHARAALWKRDSSEPGNTPGHDDPKEGTVPENLTLTDEVRKGLPEDVRDYLASLETRISALGDAGAVEPSEAAAEQTPNDDIAKRDDLPEDVRAAIAKRDEEITALRKSAEEATTIAKAERDARIEREWADRLAKFDGALPDDAASKFRALAEHNADLAEDLVKSLTSLSEQVDASALFKSAGRDVAAEGSAEGILDAKASDIAKRDGIDSVEAFAKAAEENPDVYEAYVAEKGA